jgi:4-hydroxy-2-oxoheptanedioate aldolase
MRDGWSSVRSLSDIYFLSVWDLTRSYERTGALDSGAHGVLVPLLYTADDARRLVESAKFPPVGRRGFGSPFAMGSTGGVSSVEYLQTANDSLLTIVQIETKEALQNVR